MVTAAAARRDRTKSVMTYRRDHDRRRSPTISTIIEKPTTVRHPPVAWTWIVTAPHALCRVSVPDPGVADGFERSSARQTRVVPTACDRLAGRAAQGLLDALTQRLLTSWPSSSSPSIPRDIQLQALWPDLPRRHCDLNRLTCRQTAYRRRLRQMVEQAETAGRRVLVIDVHSFRDGHGRIGSMARGAPLLVLDHCWGPRDRTSAATPHHALIRHSQTSHALAAWLPRETPKVGFGKGRVPLLCTRLGDVRTELMMQFHHRASRVWSVEFNTELNHTRLQRLVHSLARAMFVYVHGTLG